jgi:hypothetical protein
MISRNPTEQFGYASLQSSPFLPRSSAILKAGGNFSSKDEEGLKLVQKFVFVIHASGSVHFHLQIFNLRVTTTNNKLTKDKGRRTVKKVTC